MGLENSSTIAGLNAAWPLPTDVKSQGDDHLRLLKSVLQAQFPGIYGSGAVPTWLATQAQAEAGTDNTHLLTPLRGEQLNVAKARTYAGQQTFTLPPKISANPVANEDAVRLAYLKAWYMRTAYSDELVIASGGTANFTHGLSQQPSLIQGLLLCKTAEANYLVGDVVPALWNSSGTKIKFNTAWTPTGSPWMVTVRFSNNASCFSAGNRANGLDVDLTNANWRLLLVVSE